MEQLPEVPRFLTLMPWHLWTGARWRLRTLEQTMGSRAIGELRAGARRMLIVRDADAARRVLLDNGANYCKKSFSYDELRPLLGEGLFLTEGEQWKRQRRLSQPAFHHKRLQALAETMVAAVSEMLARWDDLCAQGASVDVAEEMLRLTLAVVGRALLGSDVSAIAGEVGRDLAFALRETDRRVLQAVPLPRWLPSLRASRYRRAIASLDRHVDALVRERREAAQAGREDPGDLLSMLLSARDEDDGSGLSDRELRDQVKTLLLAGHETTASSLSWSWALLGQHAEAEARLHREVDALGGRAPAFADLPRLGYAAQVVQEAMRLYPPVWIIERQAVADDALAGHRVPAGATVTIVSYLLHRNPAWWPDAQRFDPDRFAPEREKERPRFAYLPFGGGPRVCIGNAFAMMEAQIILALVAQRYRVVLDPAHPVEPDLAITLRAAGVRARLERR
jgi:cytochrome P450